jgi:hypothetical protein
MLNCRSSLLRHQGNRIHTDQTPKTNPVRLATDSLMVWCCCCRRISKNIGVPEFDIARNTLNIIYNQTLFFVGFYFSPLLAFVITFKMFVTFYIRKVRHSPIAEAVDRTQGTV